MPTRSICSRRWAARSRRRAGAAPCRSPITSAAGRGDGAPGGQVRLGLKPLYDVIAMMKGSDAARPVGRARQPPRRLGVRRQRSAVRPGRAAGGGQGASAPWSRAAGGPSARIVYASWDGEEPGLLGSTEWAETHAAELKQQGACSTSTPTATAAASCGVDGSHDFAAPGQRGRRRRDRSGDRRLACATRMRAPDARRARARRRRRRRAGQGADAKIAADPATTSRSARWARARTIRPSSQHLGMPSLNLGFGGEGEPAASITRVYDTFEHSQPLRRSGLRL